MYLSSLKGFSLDMYSPAVHHYCALQSSRRQEIKDSFTIVDQYLALISSNALYCVRRSHPVSSGLLHISKKRNDLKSKDRATPFFVHLFQVIALYLPLRSAFLPVAQAHVDSNLSL